MHDNLPNIIISIGIQAYSVSWCLPIKLLRNFLSISNTYQDHVSVSAYIMTEPGR